VRQDGREEQLATDDETRAEELLRRHATYTTAHGLHVVTAEGVGSGAVQPWATTLSGIAAPRRRAPSLADKIVVVADETAFGLHRMSIDEVRELVAPLPYTVATIWAARMLRSLWPVRDDPEGQLQLAAEVFGAGPFIGRCQEFLRSSQVGERRYLFSEQTLHVLERIVLESARPDEDYEWPEDAEGKMRRAMLGCTSVVTAGSVGAQGDADDADKWLGFFAQNGAYNANDDPLLAYQRTWRIYVELAQTDEARAHPQFVDFGALSQAASGAGLRDLFSVGFAAMATAHLKDHVEPAEEALIQPFEQFLSTTALAADHAIFTEALTAPRDFYAKAFVRSRDDPLRLAWETTPFQQKPFLRLPGNRLLSLSPRALQSWLTDGVHYRLRDQAGRGGFDAFVGSLFETYIHEVFAAALRDRPSGAGRVHADEPYGKGGGELTSDVALDYGRDLVLFEVISTRLPLGVRAVRDDSELATYLQRTILDKVKQLDRVVDDLLVGKAALDGVDMTHVDRVWPIVVGIGEMVETELLWDRVRQHIGGLLQQDVCEPLTLLGVQDAEVFAGMIAAGDDAIDLLQEKQRTGYAQTGWVNWVTATRSPLPPRLPALQDRWNQLSQEAVRVLQLPAG
jgi:hypothetical protein